MKIHYTDFPGLIVIEPHVIRDERGYFFESFRDDLLKENGFNIDFVQDNQSRSTKGVLRGLHYQLNYGQGKLVRCTYGEIFDAAIDIRKGSPTFGKVFTKKLNDKDHTSIYIPPGFAHGFCVLSEEAIFQYKCTHVYHPEDEYGIHWNDKQIEWPITEPILSGRDQNFLPLDQQDNSLLPEFEG
jgi:dTDP-4-dehydrorhamnose 3,5-epimerase